MYYLETCVSDAHVFHENVLWEDMCSRWAYLAGLCRSNHLSSFEFQHLLLFFVYSNILFALRHAFQEFIV